MEQYIVSARKYRPATFRSVVGQQSLTTTLKNAIATQHLAHAYLFCGPRGVGKTTCARIFAKTINCAHPTADGEACNECESCRGFNEQRSFNIHELDAASNNTVDDIRSLVEQVRIPPQIGKYSVYIIDEVHMLSTAAFNAFLKTLEEPPSYAIFILATTEKHKIIPTILSRCQIYDFSRIRVPDVVGHLQYVAQNEGVTAEPEALNVIAQKADGAMRDALSIFDQVVSFCGGNVTYQGVIENLNVLDYVYYFRLVDDFLSGRVNNALMAFDEILGKGFEAQHFVTGLASHLRDLLVSRDEQTKVLLEVGASIADQYVAQAKACPIPFLYKALEIVNDCDLNYRVSRNKRLLVELMLIRLCQLTDTEQNSAKPTAEPLKPVAPATTPAPQVKPATAPAAPTATPQRTAPAAPSQPAPAMSAKRPGFSISTSMTKPESTQIVSEPSATAANAPTRREPFSPDQFIAAWRQCAQILHADAHAANTIINHLPQLDHDEVYKVLVVNTLQQKDLEKYRADILAALKTRLQNDYVDFNVVVDDTMAQKAFTPEEKFAQMREKNADFNQLTKQLGLEL